MIPILTVEQMRNLDSESIHGDMGLGYQYMQKAARGLFEAVLEILPNKNYGDIQISENLTIVCGKGNNGGDGFLAAKYLLDAGYRVKCFVLCELHEIKGVARKAYDELILAGGLVSAIHEDDMEEFTKYINSSSMIIDAMLGTGTKGEPKGIFSKVIKLINESHAMILSVDTPSGLNNDNGLVNENCIKANTTVAMGYPKLGSFFYPGRTNIGSLLIKDLNYPRETLEKYFSNIFFPTHDDLKKLLPARKPAGSKFDHGLTLMLCGSRGMSGAAILSSMSSLRAGAGMVFLASPESSVNTLSNHLVEVVIKGINETQSGRPSLAAYDQCTEYAQNVNAVCIGPGISHEKETSELVRKLVMNLDVPVILDADGLNAFKDCVQELKKHKSELVITPHAGEFTRLFGELPEEPNAKINYLKKIAKEFNLTILFKGMPTIIADSNNNAYVMPYGNSGMATAGSGDVLSGIITSFIAQGASPRDAAIVGAFIHADAGNKAASVMGEYSMIASDILEKIPLAINSLK